MKNPKPDKLKPGRKTKLTPELIAQVETALRGHSTIVATCDMLGISEETFFRWKREGEAANSGLKREFSEAVKKALGMSRILLTNAIAKDPSWQAKAWLLERMFPKEYGRRQLIAHAGADGESDLPAGTGQPVNLVIKMVAAAGAENPTLESDPDPFIMKDGTDPEPHNGSDPWENEPTIWPEQRPDLPPEAAQPPLPSRGTPGFPTGQVNTNKSPLDTGGRSRDPDEP